MSTVTNQTIKPGMPTIHVRAVLGARGIFPDSLRRVGDTFVFHRRFYYALGQSAEGWAEQIRSCGFEIVSFYEGQRRGAPDSYFEVVFRVPSEVKG